jgi:hypothetical protein
LKWTFRIVASIDLTLSVCTFGLSRWACASADTKDAA